uniref:Group III truncated hemoglobin n=1 Tax=Acidobacterium capsulatum TaxID=33075 RepID=A0A7V4XUL1_9BACT
MLPNGSLSETSLRQLVDAFYARIREDDLLAPIFHSAIGDRWPEHLEKLTNFWCSVMLSAGTYKGNPMDAHLRLPRLGHAHLDRWLALWRVTTSELLPAPAALELQNKAAMMGERILETIAAQQFLDPTR